MFGWAYLDLVGGLHICMINCNAVLLSKSGGFKPHHVEKILCVCFFFFLFFCFFFCFFLLLLLLLFFLRLSIAELDHFVRR